jgi:hypothetical protein
MATADESRKLPSSARGAKGKEVALTQRPDHAEELSPETLLPEVVATDLEKTQLDDESRHARIAKRAHELAEQRGFDVGGELVDWLQAEREIDAAPVQQVPPENQFTG